MYKIGLLLPRSTYYSTIAFDLFEGFKSGLRSLGQDNVTIISENIGFGTDQQHCYRVTEKMLMQDDVSVVFAYISHRTAQLLKPLFLAANKVLIVLDSGANLPQEWPQSPNINFLSLQNSLGTLLLAHFAVDNQLKKTAVATGYYDGGYLHTLAASYGCKTAGVEILFNQATGYKRDEFTMEPLKGFLENHPEAYITTIFSGDFVQWFFEEIQKHFPNQSIPLYLSPFALEETMLSEAVFPGENTYGIACWSKKIDTPENKQFIDEVSKSGRIPGLFSLLGWEAAIMTNHLTGLIDEFHSNGRKISEALLDFRYKGPRGETYFDKEIQTTISPMYRVKLVPGANAGCELSELNPIPDDVLHAAFTSLYKQELNNNISGWFNSYTCI